MDFNAGQNSFTKGYISPYLHGRTDLDIYRNGLERCENFLPLPQGGLEKRFGSEVLGCSSRIEYTPWLCSFTVRWGIYECHLSLGLGYESQDIVILGFYFKGESRPYQIPTTWISLTDLEELNRALEIGKKAIDQSLVTFIPYEKYTLLKIGGIYLICFLDTDNVEQSQPFQVRFISYMQGATKFDNQVNPEYYIFSNKLDNILPPPMYRTPYVELRRDAMQVPPSLGLLVPIDNDYRVLSMEVGINFTDWRALRLVGPPLNPCTQEETISIRINKPIFEKSVAYSETNPRDVRKQLLTSPWYYVKIPIQSAADTNVKGYGDLFFQVWQTARSSEDVPSNSADIAYACNYTFLAPYQSKLRGETTSYTPAPTQDKSKFYSKTIFKETVPIKIGIFTGDNMPILSTKYQQRLVLGNLPENVKYKIQSEPDTIYGSALTHNFLFIDHTLATDSEEPITILGLDYKYGASVNDIWPYRFNIADDYNTRLTWLTGGNLLFAGKDDCEYLLASENAISAVNTPNIIKISTNGGKLDDSSVFLDENTFYIDKAALGINALGYDYQSGQRTEAGSNLHSYGIFQEYKCHAKQLAYLAKGKLLICLTDRYEDGVQIFIVATVAGGNLGAWTVLKVRFPAPVERMYPETDYIYFNGASNEGIATSEQPSHRIYYGRIKFFDVPNEGLYIDTEFSVIRNYYNYLDLRFCLRDIIAEGNEPSTLFQTTFASFDTATKILHLKLDANLLQLSVYYEGNTYEIVGTLQGGNESGAPLGEYITDFDLSEILGEDYNEGDIYTRRSDLVLGVKYNSNFKTLKLEVGNEYTYNQGLPTRINQISFNVYNAIGGKWKASDSSNQSFEKLPYDRSEYNVTDTSKPYTGILTMKTDTSYTYIPQIEFHQEEAGSCHIRNIVFKGVTYGSGRSY